MTPQAKAALASFIELNLVTFVVGTALPALVNLWATNQAALPADSPKYQLFGLSIAVVVAIRTYMSTHRQELNDVLDNILEASNLPQSPNTALPVALRQSAPQAAQPTPDQLARVLGVSEDPTSPVKPAIDAAANPLVAAPPPPQA